jgi:hypothetical protein
MTPAVNARSGDFGPASEEVVGLARIWVFTLPIKWARSAFGTPKVDRR